MSLNEKSLTEALGARPFQFFAEVESTQDIAFEWLRQGAPVGVDFGAVGYVYSSGNVLLDEALPLEDTQAQLHSIFASYVRSIDLFGLSGRISASWRAASTSRSIGVTVSSTPPSGRAKSKTTR